MDTEALEDTLADTLPVVETETLGDTLAEVEAGAVRDTLDDMEPLIEIY